MGFVVSYCSGGFGVGGIHLVMFPLVVVVGVRFLVSVVFILCGLLCMVVPILWRLWCSP